MDENNNKDIMEEELEALTPEDASVAEDIANEAETVSEEEIAAAEEIVSDAENTSEEIGEVEETIETETAASEVAQEDIEQPAKKKFPLQIPVIIALCILVAALLGYFVYNAFLLKEPEGVTWSTEIDGLTYYLDFNTDNTFHAYIGSIEVEGTYTKAKNQPKQDYTGATFDESETVDTLTLDYQIANFYPGYAAEYNITGSRILGNQVLNCSYGEGFSFSFNQSKRQTPELEVSSDFQPDEQLVGTWVFNYQGSDIYKMIINDDGTISIKKYQEGSTYNGTYTISDGQINFTYYVNENTVVPLDYSIDGDILSCLGVNFVREGSNATPDQPFAMTAEEAAAAQ